MNMITSTAMNYRNISDQDMVCAKLHYCAYLGIDTIDLLVRKLSYNMTTFHV